MPVAAARAFRWDSLPYGFQITAIVSGALFLIYLIAVWRSNRPWPERREEADRAIELLDHRIGVAQRELVRVQAAEDDAQAAVELANVASAKAKKAEIAAVEARRAAARGKRASDGEERSLAASAVGSYVTLAGAAAAVLLTGAGVLLGLEGKGTPLPTPVFTQLVIAIGWLVASLLLGTTSAAYVITHIHRPESVAENRVVIVNAAGQLIALAVGAVDFMLSIVLF